MEADKRRSLETAWSKEQKWFKRTIIACFVMFLALAGFVGVQYWIFTNVVSTITSAGGEDFKRVEDSLFRAQLAILAVGVLLILSAIIFLTSMIRWLLAIRARRRCLVEGGDLISK